MCYNTYSKKGVITMEVLYDKEFYYKFHRFVKKYMELMYHIEVTGKENLTGENVIYAGNHLNILDSWLLMSQVDDDDYVRFMVDNKLYRYRLWEIFFKKLGTFGINPDKTDTAALKMALDLLREGESICIFPEGHTHSRKIDLEYKPGVARLSRMANVPIVPFGIDGSYKPFHTLSLNIGEPINYKQSDIPKEEVDNDLEQRIKGLIKRK